MTGDWTWKNGWHSEDLRLVYGLLWLKSPVGSLGVPTGHSLMGEKS